MVMLRPVLKSKYAVESGSRARTVLLLLSAVAGILTLNICLAKPTLTTVWYIENNQADGQYFPTADAATTTYCANWVAYEQSLYPQVAFAQLDCWYQAKSWPYYAYVKYSETSYDKQGNRYYSETTNGNYLRPRNGYLCDDGSAVLDATSCHAPKPKVNKPKTLGSPPKCPMDKTISPVKGDPIHLYTGNVYEAQTDYEGRGAFPLAFRRYYNSQNTEPGHLGPNWRDSYDRQVKLASSGIEADVVRPTGKVLPFSQSGGTWQGDSDVRGRLSQTAAGWTYKTARGTVERYDASGVLQSITRRGGYTQTLGYDASGNLATVTGPFGRVLTLAYDGSGRVATVTDPSGGNYSYTYDSAGNLIEVTYPDGATRQYLYENSSFPHALTGIVDANGNRYLTWTYDSRGRATSDAFAGGTNKTTLQYNSDGTTTVTDALGHQHTYHFLFAHGLAQVARIAGGYCAGCANDTASETFDANGYLASSTDFNGNQTTYVNNARGLQTRRTEAVGTPQQRTITTQWAADENLPVKITEPGKSTAFSYDARGRLLTRRVTDTATGNSRTWTYSYNALGLLAGTDGPRADVSDTTTYAYDSQGNLTGVTDALGHTSRITAHDADGRPLSLVDANGLATQLGYDARGRLISRNVGGEVTTFAYDAAGNVTRITLPDGRYLAYTYDAAHRLVGIADQLGDTIRYTLDAAGNRTRESIDDPSGNLTQTRSHVYNDLSQLVEDVGAAGQTTTYGYDGNGNRISTQDALNNTTTQAFDALNRLTTVTDPLNGVTRYGYDGQDNLTSVTDPNGNTTTYTYNGFGDRTSVTSPDTGKTTYTYDSAGNVVSKTDAKGQTTTYAYDALNRLTRASFADGTATTYAYDTATNGIGRLASISDPTGQTSWSYDAHGRVTGVRRDFHGVVLSTAYTYDASGRLVGMTYPSGTQVDYSYSNGQLTGVNVNGQPLMTGITYQPFGAPQSWTWGDGTASTRSYDQDGQLTALSLAGDTRTLSYDPVGDITAIDDSRANRSYGYDALMRLTAANDDSRSWDYAYDPNGNRTSLTDASGTTSYRYVAGSNRLASLSGARAKSYRHDANGNIVSDGSHSYQYDARNRLVGVDGTVSYALNGMGQRVEKRTSTADTLYLYGVNGRLIVEADPVGRTEREYVYVNGVPAAVLVYRSHGNTAHAGTGIANRSSNASNTPAAAKGQTPTVAGLGGTKTMPQSPTGLYYIHTDHLGTPRAVTDSSGTVVWRWDGEPFGATAANDDPDGDGVAFTFNLRFPGQYHDAETGLNYNYFRDYDPRTGRYVESDPIGLDGGLNTYLYSTAKPLIWYDVDGQDPIGGERGATGGASGQRTNRPNKKCRELNPPDPRYVECKHHQTGKWIKKPRPSDMPFPGQPAGTNNQEMCGSKCKGAAKIATVGGTGYIIYRCVRMLPSLFPPLWETIPLNAAAP